MPTEIIIGVLSLAGTCIGSIAGIMASNKLTTYRIEQLERKVDAHNSLVERVYGCESNINVLNERVSNADKRIDEIEGGNK